MDKDFAYGSEANRDLVERIYGSPEDMLAYLEASDCQCDFCHERILWLKDSLASGRELKPPYVQPGK